MPLEVGSGSPSVSSGTIASGTAITDAIDLQNQRAHRIALPSGWTSAAVTFQSSHLGETYNDLYTDSGEYTISSSVAGASRSIVLDQSVFYGIRFIKIRSGTSASPVNQGADRTITVVTVPR